MKTRFGTEVPDGAMLVMSIESDVEINTEMPIYNFDGVLIPQDRVHIEVDGDETRFWILP